jgi:hypothetical protein
MAIDLVILLMRIACWISKAMDKLFEYVLGLLIDFSR